MNQFKLKYELFIHKYFKNSYAEIVFNLLDQGYFISTSNGYSDGTDINQASNDFNKIIQSIESGYDVIYIFSEPLYLNNPPKDSEHYKGWIRFNLNESMNYSVSDYVNNNFMRSFFNF